MVLLFIAGGTGRTGSFAQYNRRGFAGRGHRDRQAARAGGVVETGSARAFSEAPWNLPLRENSFREGDFWGKGFAAPAIKEKCFSLPADQYRS